MFIKKVETKLRQKKKMKDKNSEFKPTLLHLKIDLVSLLTHGGSFR